MFPGPAARGLQIESVPFRIKILDIPQSGKKGLDVSMGGRYGVPAVGTKVFVRCNQMVDGFEDVPQEFVGIVPQAA